MPRRNRNVRERNLPRAAQRQPRKYTERTQFDVRGDEDSSRQPSALDRADAELTLYTGYSAKLD